MLEERKVFAYVRYVGCAMRFKCNEKSAFFTHLLARPFEVRLSNNLICIFEHHSIPLLPYALVYRMNYVRLT